MTDWIETLHTSSPQEGFELAIQLSQKGVEYIQPNQTIREMLRPVYARNPQTLIDSTHVIALHFQTIAQANNYWMYS